jgi:hypothetical protein
MKKITLFTIVILLVSFHSFSEIVNWKGMEMGIEQNPKWLSAYTQQHNEKLLRKKFDVDKTEKVIVGIGNASSLESARTGSQLDGQKKASELNQNGKVRLQPVYEFWQEDDKNGFTVYSVYTI